MSNGTMESHTPGPWIAKPAAGHGIHGQSIVYAESDGRGIATVNNDRDAALIAVAPRMLELCKALLRAPSVGSDGYGTTTLALQSMYLRDAREIIAEVEGRS